MSRELRLNTIRDYFAHMNSRRVLALPKIKIFVGPQGLRLTSTFESGCKSTAFIWNTQIFWQKNAKLLHYFFQRDFDEVSLLP